MTTRANGYNAYGLSREKVKELFMLCQSENFEHLELLKECAVECYPAISEQIVTSITKKLSYDKISFTTYIPLYINDFYGYRRKTLAMFNERLEELKNERN